MVLRSKLTKILQWHRFFQCYNLNTLGLISSLLRIGLPAGQLSTSKHNPRWQRAKHSMCFAAVLWCTVQLCTCLKQASWDYVHASYLSSDLMFQLVSDVGAGQTSSVLCLSWGDPSVTKHQSVSMFCWCQLMQGIHKTGMSSSLCSLPHLLGGPRASQVDEAICSGLSSCSVMYALHELIPVATSRQLEVKLALQPKPIPRRFGL